MKKSVKIILITLGIIIFLIIIDLISILNFNKPIFAIKENNQKYIGILYDTYNCPEYSVAQIKLKGTKFTCATIKNNESKVLEIIDTTKEIDDFVCAEALEQFYEDENYNYFYSCMKGKYIIVKYEDDTTEQVSEALKKGVITIADLDEYNISYYKEPKQ